MSDDVSLPFARQDLDTVRNSLDSIGSSAEKVAGSLSKTFSNAIVSGKSFDQTLQTILTSLSKVGLNAALQPVTQGLTSLVSSAFSGLTGGIGGGSSAIVAPFADGGVVAQPTFFGSNGGLGLMGERGAEAILPLARGSDGRLGIAAPGAGTSPASVTVNITTQDADSFRRSQVQVAGALARAVARGQRAL